MFEQKTCFLLGRSLLSHAVKALAFNKQPPHLLRWGYCWRVLHDPAGGLMRGCAGAYRGRQAWSPHSLSRL